jgi:myo-inositol-1(or 4)-monophosphatase
LSGGKSPTGGSGGGGKFPPRTARVGRAPATSGRERENASPRHRSALSGRSPSITVMINAAMKAARTLRRDFGEIENLQISEKAPSDFVSQADMRVEEFLREELIKVRPGYGFVGEEGKPIEGDGKNRFIVDPLDGTTNFLHGIPHFAISIALEREGEVIAGVVYEPIGDELFWAEKGAGAFLDTAFAKSRRLRVSARRKMGECIVGTGIPFRGRGDHPAFLKEMGAVMGETAGIRRMGVASLDLAFVAAGRLDGYWESGLKAWDVAAGVLLVREAGGMVSEIGGKAHRLDSPTVLAANGNIGPTLDRLLRGAARD